MLVALAWGPRWLAREGRAPQAAPAPHPSWERIVGTYRSSDPWIPAPPGVICRRGRLLMTAPWLEPDGELDLVLLPDGRFRVGARKWLPDRLSFDTMIDGQATRAVYDRAPFYRTFT